MSKKGSDAWWYMSTEDLLPEKYRQNASEYYKGTDTMDVWFDSGMQFWHTNCGILNEYFILHGPNLLAPIKDYLHINLKIFLRLQFCIVDLGNMRGDIIA